MFLYLYCFAMAIRFQNPNTKSVVEFPTMIFLILLYFQGDPHPKGSDLPGKRRRIRIPGSYSSTYTYNDWMYGKASFL